MRPKLSGDVKRALLPSPKGRTVYITLGNSLRGDDRAAEYIAENLRVHGRDIVVIRAENRPEGVLNRAVEARPAKTVIIDAVDFGGEAGAVRAFDESRIFGTALSSHRFPPEIIAAILREETGSEVRFVGIQIQQAAYGSPMEARVKRSADSIIDFLNIHFGDTAPQSLH